MKILNAVLSVLLIVAVTMIVKLKQDQKPPTKVLSASAEKITEPEVVLVLHLDDPVGTLKRYYELFPGSQITELDIGNNDPNSKLAQKIKAKLGLPITSGITPFPEKLINQFIKKNKNGQFLHFSNIAIGFSNLGIGSKTTTPKCIFPPINRKTGKPIVGQVIPWVKMAGNAKPFYTRALDLGFSACDTFITERKEGYVIDPQGFLMLLNGEVTEK